MRRIYIDNSASSRVDDEVVREMLPYFTENYGNASSLHSFGSEAKEAMEKARGKVAAFIGAKASEIIFTAGGTESDNMALRGVAYANRAKGNHIITSNIEHPAVLETCMALEREGFAMSYVKVDGEGLVDAADVAKAITPKTVLVSIMHANNEIGTVQPVEEIGKVCREKGVAFHTDAVQSAGKIPIDVRKISAGLLTLTAHKFHGPKGVGALFVGEGVRLQPIITGGGHEKGLRSSTENVPGIAGMGKACEVAGRDLEKNAAKMRKMRDRLVGETLKIEETYLNGSREKRLPHNANFRFLGIEGESLVMMLDEKGIAASTGSACSSKKLQASHVLLALGLPEWQTHGSLRLTLSKYNTQEEVAGVLEILPGVVSRLRGMSPVWRRIKAGERIEDSYGKHVH